MNDVIKKYINMIEAIECDFILAKQGNCKLDMLQEKLNNKDYKLMKDIDLLEELSFNLRHGKIKIVEG